MFDVLLLTCRVGAPSEMDEGGHERADAGVRLDDGNRQPLMWTCVSSVVLRVGSERAFEPLEMRREQVGQRRSCEEQASTARSPHQTGSLARWCEFQRVSASLVRVPTSLTRQAVWLVGASFNELRLVGVSSKRSWEMAATSTIHRQALYLSYH